MGLLPEHIVKQVAPATKTYWRKNNYSNYFAPEVLYAQQDNMEMIKAFLSRKKLLYAAKALYRIYQFILPIAIQTDGFTHQLKAKKTMLIQLIENCKKTLGLKRATRLVGISAQQFYAWKSHRKCASSIFNSCYKRFPNQLPGQEVSLIKGYLLNPKFKGWSTISIYYQLIRDKAAFMSSATFYRYARRLNLTQPRPKKPRYAKGIRADSAKKLFHMDVTIFKLPDNIKVYIYVLIDNYSRFILNVTASLMYSPHITLQNLTEGFEKYGIDKLTHDRQLVCDAGVENKGPVNEQLNNWHIGKVIAQQDVAFSNSMVEAANKRIKYDFVYWQHFSDLASLSNYLPTLIEQYNNKPHSALFGFTPKEVFIDRIIPSKNNFQGLIQQAASTRSTTNANQACDGCY